jgi:hypothetical protein
MRKAPLFAAVGILILTAGSMAFGEEKGVSGAKETPGHEMQEHGSVPGNPGASGYAPGHTKDADDVRGKGTTGAGGDRDAFRKKGDRDDVKLKGDHDRDDLKVKRDRD